MRICFIGDSNSIHVKRIVSYYVKQQDDVLVLSTSVTRSDIFGTRTVHLRTRNKEHVEFSGGERGTTGLIAYWKSFIPRAVKGFISRTIRDLRVLGLHRLCLEEIARFNPDIMYCHRSFPEGVLAWRCGVRPLLLRTAGPDISKLPKYPVYRQLIRKALLSANVVLTESLWERDCLKKLCGDGVQIEIKVIGIDATTFRPRSPQETLRDKYGLPRDAFVVVTNRYLNGHYNGWLVVEAIESILEACPKLVLFYTSPLKMDVSTKGRVDAITRRFSRVQFVEGPVAQSELADMLGCGNVYISFSSYDGIPNSVLETMACGIVPIVGDLPQLHEWIEHGVDGYIVPQNDVKGLASVVSYLYNHREVLPNMSARCIKKVQTQASYELCSKQTRELLQAIVQLSSLNTQKIE